MNDLASVPTEHLISRVRSHGDARAWEELYERHDGRLRALARKLMGRKIAAEYEAEDVAGVVWERILPVIPHFEAREGRGSFFRALATKARHVVAELGRRGGEGKRRLDDSGRLAMDFLESAPCEGPGVVTRAHCAEVVERVRRAIEDPRLSKTYRAVLIESLIEGRPKQEIARRHGLTMEGLKKRLQRGREVLAVLLDEVEA